MTAETYLLFVAPFLVLGFGLTIAAIEEVSSRRKAQHVYARANARRRDINR